MKIYCTHSRCLRPSFGMNIQPSKAFDAAKSAMERAKSENVEGVINTIKKQGRSEDCLSINFFNDYLFVRVFRGAQRVLMEWEQALNEKALPNIAERLKYSIPTPV